MKPIVENILDMVEDMGEEEVQQDLESFSSPKNPEIEHFLKNNAIIFAKKKMSVTYIISDANDGSILGYFTLANKIHIVLYCHYSIHNATSYPSFM